MHHPFWGLLLAGLLAFAPGARAEDPCTGEENNRANALYLQKRYRESTEISRAAIARWKGTEPPTCQMAVTLANLAAACFELGDFAEAEQQWRRSARVWEKLGDAGQTGLLEIRNDLLTLYVETGYIDRARQVARQIARTDFEALGLSPLQRVKALNNLGSFYSADRSRKQAEVLLREAAKILEQAGLGRSPHMAAVQANLGRTRMDERRYQEAGEHFRMAYSILEGDADPDPLTMARVLAGLAEGEAAAGRFGEAVALMARALRVTEEKLGATHPTAAEVLTRYAGLLQRTHHKQEAKAMRARARAVLSLHQHDQQEIGSRVDAGDYRGK